MARPKLQDEQRRDTRLKIYFTRAEADRILEVAGILGVDVAEWMRSVIMAATTSVEASYEGRKTPSTPTSNGNSSYEGRKTTTHVVGTVNGNTSYEGRKTTTAVVADPSHRRLSPMNPVMLAARKRIQSLTTQTDLKEPARPRTRPTCLGEGQDPETNSLNLESKQDSSLRSHARADALADSESSPWQPAPDKLRIKLADGSQVTNIWLWTNALRLSPADITTILETPRYHRAAKSMIAGFAETLRRVYRRKWCAVLNRKVTSWKDTTQALKAFETAGRILAEEFARRGMTADQYLDAAIEMRPKAVKFPTPQMLAGALGEAIRNWVPREQRQADQNWSSHEDKDGLRWINTGDGQGAILLVNSQESREALFKMAKVR